MERIFSESMHSEDNSSTREEEEALQDFILRLRDWQDKQSWDEVYRRYHKLVHSVACRAGLNEAEAWDAVQETFVSLAKQSLKGTYDPQRGSFKSWLLHVAQWRINDQLRKRGREAEELPPEDVVADSRSEQAESPWEREGQLDLMRAALSRLKLRFPRQFSLFEAYVLRGVNATEVGQQFGVAPEQVYLAKHRMESRLRKEVEKMRRRED